MRLHLEFSNGVKRDIPAPDFPIWVSTSPIRRGATTLMPSVLIDGVEDEPKLLMGRVTLIEYVPD